MFIPKLFLSFAGLERGSKAIIEAIEIEGRKFLVISKDGVAEWLIEALSKGGGN